MGRAGEAHELAAKVAPHHAPKHAPAPAPHAHSLAHHVQEAAEHAPGAAPKLGEPTVLAAAKGAGLPTAPGTANPLQ